MFICLFKKLIYTVLITKHCDFNGLFKKWKFNVYQDGNKKCAIKNIVIGWGLIEFGRKKPEWNSLGLYSPDWNVSNRFSWENLLCFLFPAEVLGCLNQQSVNFWFACAVLSAFANVTAHRAVIPCDCETWKVGMIIVVSSLPCFCREMAVWCIIVLWIVAGITFL